MAKITMEMIQQAYETAKHVHAGSLGRSAGYREIVRVTGMRDGMAQVFVTDFLSMMEGKCYHYCMSQAATEYFLEQIGQDYGRERQHGAARAVLEHVAYYRTVRNNLPGIERIARRYL